VWMIEAVPDGGSRLTAFYRIPQGRQWIAQRVESIRTAFNQAQPDSYQAKNSEELFDALFPLSHANDIGNHSSLTIIPDDALFLIAFEMLSPNATRGSFELMGKSIRYYPSLSALRIGRGAHEQGEWPEAFLGVGDPVTSPNDPRYVLATTTAPLQQTAPAKDAAGPVSVDSDRIATIRSRGFSFERIPETAHEVKDVAGLFQAEGQNAKVMLGLDATKVQLESMDLAQFKFLHFATHGVLPVDGGISEPSLVFSFDGTTPQNMLFSVSDILKMAISADTVVLSACNTGSGKVSHAEGVMSLGRAFMAAGAHSVTVSLWAVSDDSTQMFMEEYYKNLINGKDKPEALALSRSYVFAKGFKSPFFWAPFVLIGE